MRIAYYVNDYPVREIKAYTAKTGYRKHKDKHFIYETPDACLFVEYELQPTGYGKKPLLICPRCRNRRSKLYHAGHFVFCRSCLPAVNPYRARQNSTKQGSDHIIYLMERLAKKSGVDYFELSDFIAENWIEIDKRPRYMRKATFADIVGRLTLLDELRCCCLWGKYVGRGSTVEKWELRYICKAPPVDLMGIDLYRDIIELAEEVYRVPIKDRLLARQ